MSSTEQASNEAVAKNFWRYLLSNPDRYIYKGVNLSARLVRRIEMHAFIGHLH